MKNLMSILLVEDDCADVMLFKRALKDVEIINPLVHFINCKEALAYLKDRNNEKPWIILIDLNTLEMKGFEFLRILKSDDVLSQIPIIILTGSSDETDIAESFKLGASGYMVKPNDYKELVEIVSAIHRYWTLSKLPDSRLDSRLDRPASPRAVVKQ